MRKSLVIFNEDYIKQIDVIKNYHISREKLYKFEQQGLIHRHINKMISERVVFYEKKEIEDLFKAKSYFERIN